jgi:hypothetical protein
VTVVLSRGELEAARATLNGVREEMFRVKVTSNFTSRLAQLSLSILTSRMLAAALHFSNNGRNPERP